MSHLIDGKVWGVADGEWMRCRQCGGEFVHSGSRWMHSTEDCVRLLEAKLRIATTSLDLIAGTNGAECSSPRSDAAGALKRLRALK